VSATGPAARRRVELPDGSELVVRAIEPADRELLLEGFRELSPQSRYTRFFTPMRTLDSGWLDYLTRVDHHDHEALVAETATAGEPVGVARYIRLQGRPATAEVAVTVIDEWQGRGAGSALLALLSSRARNEGIDWFHATCLAENHAVLELFRGFSAVRSERTEGNVVEIDMALPD